MALSHVCVNSRNLIITTRDDEAKLKGYSSCSILRLKSFQTPRKRLWRATETDSSTWPFTSTFVYWDFAFVATSNEVKDKSFGVVSTSLISYRAFRRRCQRLIWRYSGNSQVLRVKRWKAWSFGACSPLVNEEGYSWVLDWGSNIFFSETTSIWSSGTTDPTP